jgi:hypothetical protein
MAGWYYVCLHYTQSEKRKKAALCTHCVTSPELSVIDHNLGVFGENCRRLFCREDGARWRFVIIVGPCTESVAREFDVPLMGKDTNAMLDLAYDHAVQLAARHGVPCYTDRQELSAQEEYEILAAVAPDIAALYLDMFRGGVAVKREVV